MIKINIAFNITNSTLYNLFIVELHEKLFRLIRIIILN